MPSGIFVPARAEDLALSFASGFDAAAQGAVPYRTATGRYAALAPGTAGQMLLSGGAAANPAWGSAITPAADAASIFRVTNAAAASVLSVNTDAASQNAVLVSRPATTLSVVQRYNTLNVTSTVSDAAPTGAASMTALELASFYNGAGTLAALYGGYFTARNTGATSTVTNLYGASFWIRNTAAGAVGTGRCLQIEPPTNAGSWTTNYGIDLFNQGLAGMTTSVGLRIQAQSGATNSYALTTAGGNVGIGTATPTTASLQVQSLVAAQRILQVRAHASQSQDCIEVTDSSGNGMWMIRSDYNVDFGRLSSTNTARNVCGINAGYSVNTDASRRGKMELVADDFNGERIFLTGGADGTNPMIGFLGASAVARQVIGAAATDPATTMTLANNIRTALINLGLCSAA